jgi:hypothetical protein
MKTDPIWYLIAQDAYKTSDRPMHNREEKAAFLEGALAALETAAKYGLFPPKPGGNEIDEGLVESSEGAIPAQ